VILGGDVVGSFKGIDVFKGGEFGCTYNLGLIGKFVFVFLKLSFVLMVNMEHELMFDASLCNISPVIGDMNHNK
jgi:hypothetical protein